MGQAKLKNEKGVAVSGTSGRFKKIMIMLSTIYTLYMTVFFVLYCPDGYILYDLYKRNMFIIPTAVFLVAELGLWLLSMDDSDRVHVNYREWYSRIDLIGFALIISWFIGSVAATDREAAFFGDTFREVGFVSMALSVLVMIFISHIGGWKKVNTYAAIAVMFVVFEWQILNSFLVDPLNWQKHGTYPHLVACLANTDQNAMFDGVFIAILIGMMLLSEKLYDRILCAVVAAIGVAAGMLTGAETFYFGLLAVLLVMAGFALSRGLLKWLGLAGAALWLGVLLHRVGVGAFSTTTIAAPGTVAGLLDSTPVMAGLLGLVLLMIIISLFYDKAPLRVHRVVFRGYCALVIGILVLAIVFMLVLYPNRESMEGPIAAVFNDIQMRVDINMYTMKLFEKGSILEKLFGIGFGNYSLKMNYYFPEEMQGLFFGSTLADSHNIFFDQLINAGIVGAALFAAMFTAFFVICGKALSKSCPLVGKKLPDTVNISSDVAAVGSKAGNTEKKESGERNTCIILVGVAVTAAFLATGLINFTLIVVTPLVFIAMGAALYAAGEQN